MRLEFDALRHDRFLRYLNLFCKSVLKGPRGAAPFVVGGITVGTYPTFRCRPCGRYGTTSKFTASLSSTGPPFRKRCCNLSSYLPGWSWPYHLLRYTSRNSVLFGSRVR